MRSEKLKRWLKRTLLAFCAFAFVVVAVLCSRMVLARARGVREDAKLGDEEFRDLCHDNG
jgi:hypothetical protein